MSVSAVETPLDRFWYTDYRYHRICMHCGYVAHCKPGYSPDGCPKCGYDCWKLRCWSSPNRPESPLVQWLDPDCAECRKTLAKIKQLSEPQFTQESLFDES